MLGVLTTYVTSVVDSVIFWLLKGMLHYYWCSHQRNLSEIQCFSTIGVSVSFNLQGKVQQAMHNLIMPIP